MQVTACHRLCRCFIALSSLFVCCLVNGQTAKANLKPQPLAREVMYRILFREVANFQAKADEFAQQTKPDGFLRQHHRTMLQLNDAEDAQLRQVSIDCVRQLRDLDTQAAAIINDVKARYRHAPRGSANAVVPPLPQELLDLEAKRTALVLSAATSLSSSFGPAQFAFFEGKVRRYVGSNFRALNVRPVK